VNVSEIGVKGNSEKDLVVSQFDYGFQRGDAESAEKRGEMPELRTLCDPLRPPRLCDERFLSKQDITKDLSDEAQSPKCTSEHF
jgi:hypothetical protein